MAEGSRTCHLCGTSAPETLLAAQVIAPPPPPVPVDLPALGPCPPGMRICPACGKTYARDYTDSFCACGVELVEPPPVAEPPRASGPKRPAAGTPCLVLYGGDKQPLMYLPLTKDATLIGRLDAVAGNFPDIDVTEFLDPPTARKVSRKHALVLRSRATQKFVLRPLAGNTGTQIEGDMVPALSDYPLTPGMRVILGGAVRMKFEIT
jgi:hypothetical protein